MEISGGIFQTDIAPVTLAELFRGDLVADFLVGRAGEDAFIEQVMFVAVRAAGNNFARGGAVDAGKIEELAFGSGVEIEKRVLASGPAVADAFGGGASFVGSFVSGFAELSASVLDGGFCPLGGFGDFFAGSFVAGALVGSLELQPAAARMRAQVSQKARVVKLRNGGMERSSE